MVRAPRTDPLEDDQFSRSGAAVSVLFSALPYAAMGGVLPQAAGLAGLIAIRWGKLPRTILGGGLPLALGAAFLAWAAASALWSPVPGTAKLLAWIAAAIAPLLLAMGADLARTADCALARRAAGAGLAVLVAGLVVEALFNFPIARSLWPSADPSVWLAQERNALALAVLWAWGVAAMLARAGGVGWAAAAGMFAGIAWLTLRLPAAEASAALAYGLLAALAALAWPRGAVSVAALTAAVIILAAPTALPTLATLAGQITHSLMGQEPSFQWLAQVDTWSFTTAQIIERPVHGWGFAASARFTDTHVLQGFAVRYIPGHPHSAAMQLWLETGLVGAFLLAGAVAAFGRRAGASLAQDRVAAAAAAGVIAAATAFATFSVELWATWFWAGLGVAAALVRSARAAP